MVRSYVVPSKGLYNPLPRLLILPRVEMFSLPAQVRTNGATMSPYLATLFISPLLVILVQAQEAPPFPAAEELPDAPASGAPWSPAERVQLTDKAFEVIADELPELAELWKFNDGSGKPIESGECRSFPGDESWPSSDVWDTFGKVLGEGTLIPTVPLAAPCYDSWGVYDNETCAFIQENFADPYLQSVIRCTSKKDLSHSNHRKQRGRSHIGHVANLPRPDMPAY